jgi:hypothetical protein
MHDFQTSLSEHKNEIEKLATLNKKQSKRLRDLEFLLNNSNTEEGGHRSKVTVYKYLTFSSLMKFMK